MESARRYGLALSTNICKTFHSIWGHCEMPSVGVQADQCELGQRRPQLHRDRSMQTDLELGGLSSSNRQNQPTCHNAEVVFHERDWSLHRGHAFICLVASFSRRLEKALGFSQLTRTIDKSGDGWKQELVEERKGHAHRQSTRCTPFHAATSAESTWRNNRFVHVGSNILVGSQICTLLSNGCSDGINPGITTETQSLLAVVTLRVQIRVPTFSQLAARYKQTALHAPYFSSSYLVYDTAIGHLA